MREILFRGIRKHKVDCNENQWVEGDFFSDETAIYTKLQNLIEVIPETVGQFTGLLDNNGNKIFEDDIVQSIELELKGVIIFDEYCRFMIKDMATKSTYLLARNNEEIKVIGNIHDNPELLERSNNGT